MGVCAALEQSDFITSTFRGHGHALAKGLSPEELALRAFRRRTGCCRGKGGSMHVGDMERGWCRASPSWGGHSARRGHGAGAQDAEEPGNRRLFFRRRCRRRRGVSRRGQPRGHLGPSGHFCLRKQPLWRVDPRRPGDAKPADRRPGRRLWHHGEKRSMATMSWPSTRRPARRPPNAGAASGPVLLELLTYRRTGPLPARRLPLSGQGRTRRMVRPRPDRAVGPALDANAGSPSQADLEAHSHRNPAQVSRPPSSWPVASRCHRSTS